MCVRVLAWIQDHDGRYAVDAEYAQGGKMSDTMTVVLR